MLKFARYISYFTTLLLAGLFWVPSQAQQLHNTYANGIYFDSSGLPHYPQLYDTADTTIFLFDTPGDWPTGLTKQGNTLYWLADSDADSSKLYKLSQTGGIVATYNAPLNGYAGLEYDGTYLWAVYEYDFELHRIDRTTGEVDTVISLPQPDSLYPDRHAWGIAWDGQYFWHSQYGDDAMIFKIDPATWAPVDTIMLDVNLILAIAYRAPYIYGIHIGNQRIYRYDTETGEMTDSYMWPIGYPLGLYYDSPSGNFINVSSKIEYGGNEAVYMVGITTGIDDNLIPVPSSASLLTAYPNPFNSTTIIRYSLTGQSSVALDIYNVLGQRVDRLLDGTNHSAGEYTITWNPQGLPSGMYFARVRTSEGVKTAKLVYLK